MRFFITETERKNKGSSSFIEFQKGRYNGECWHIDSLCMDENLFYELHLRSFFTMVLPQFDYYGITQVSAEEFGKMKESAAGFSTDVYECMQELSEWVESYENEDILFTICGM